MGGVTEQNAHGKGNSSLSQMGTRSQVWQVGNCGDGREALQHGVCLSDDAKREREYEVPKM